MAATSGESNDMKHSLIVNLNILISLSPLTPLTPFTKKADLRVHVFNALNSDDASRSSSAIAPVSHVNDVAITPSRPVPGAAALRSSDDGEFFKKINTHRHVSLGTTFYTQFGRKKCFNPF